MMIHILIRFSIGKSPVRVAVMARRHIRALFAQLERFEERSNCESIRWMANSENCCTCWTFPVSGTLILA